MDRPCVHHLGRPRPAADNEWWASRGVEGSCPSYAESPAQPHRVTLCPIPVPCHAARPTPTPRSAEATGGGGGRTWHQRPAVRSGAGAGPVTAVWKSPRWQTGDRWGADPPFLPLPPLSFGLSRHSETPVQEQYQSSGADDGFDGRDWSDLLAQPPLVVESGLL